MINKFRRLDHFNKNVIIVFAGASLLNFFNLLYQLLIAHKLSAVNFAAFNSLLSIFVVVSAPLCTIQTAVAKFASEFIARGQIKKTGIFLSRLFRKFSIFAIFTFFIFCLGSFYVIDALKIPSLGSAYILAAMLAAAWLIPFFKGGIQGLELFAPLSFGMALSGALKLALGLVFIVLGYEIAGVMAAYFISELGGLGVYYFYLRGHIGGNVTAQQEQPDYKGVFLYLLPVAGSYFCFMLLVNFDMILVKYFFAPFESGLYSLAQMVGKIFLFLPIAISMVMFPRTSAQKAKNMDTFSTLKKSLLYTLSLCIIACLFYNIFPSLVLKILTGKVYPESLFLGRLFSISMSFFTLSYVLILYFLSLKELHFIKYLVFFTVLQSAAILIFHRSLAGVQIILCLNSILLFLSHIFLAYKYKKNLVKSAIREETPVI